jgi:hypothetical protein
MHRLEQNNNLLENKINHNTGYTIGKENRSVSPILSNNHRSRKFNNYD